MPSCTSAYYSKEAAQSLITGLSLNFPGLSQIRSDSPHFQADFETIQHDRDIMSFGIAVVVYGGVVRQMRKALVFADILANLRLAGFFERKIRYDVRFPVFSQQFVARDCSGVPLAVNAALHARRGSHRPAHARTPQARSRLRSPQPPPPRPDHHLGRGHPARRPHRRARPDGRGLRPRPHRRPL